MKNEETIIVCRCEDISMKEVLDAIDEGYRDFQELRKKLRVGMGACQGRVCLRLVEKILEEKTGRKTPKGSLPRYRPPLVPVSLGTLASDEKCRKKQML